MTPEETANTEAWTVYGDHHIERGTPLPEVERIDWGPGGAGPGDAIFGDLDGRRVLDLGCGPARHAATSPATTARSWMPSIPHPHRLNAHVPATTSCPG
ncbi:hypothetical protein [Streptomyces viridochromogenes]|uniref:hypothetical protein n=1 Tax=Streptomyces viridochromogenes TaxID=1938 RepID=UPI0002F79BD5